MTDRLGSLAPPLALAALAAAIGIVPAGGVALAPSVGLAIVGLALLAVGLVTAREPTTYGALAIVGAAIVVASGGSTAGARTWSLAAAGIVCFLAAEQCDRRLGQGRRSTDARWQAVAVSGAAVAAAVMAVLPDVAGGGGPLALAAGTLAAVALAGLAAATIRADSRAG